MHQCRPSDTRYPLHSGVRVRVREHALDRPSNWHRDARIRSSGGADLSAYSLPASSVRPSTAGDKSCCPVVGGRTAEQNSSRSWTSWMLELAGASLWTLLSCRWKGWQNTSLSFPGNTQKSSIKAFIFFLGTQIKAPPDARCLRCGDRI